MKAGIVRLHAECVLELNETEVAIINHYLNYGFDHIAAVSKMYTAEEVETVFRSLRESTERILASTKDARPFVFDERYRANCGGSSKVMK